MGGILLLLAFLLLGIGTMDGILADRNRLTRLWFGCSAGLIMMMWFPALWAFLLDFTAEAQYAGLVTASVFAAVSLIVNKKRRRNSVFSPISVRLLLCLLIPFALLSGYLQYTHTLRAAADGSLHVGQSTYGDLCLHLGIATSLRNAAFAPEYSLLPGTLLGYPFLGDSMVTSMILLGTPLKWGFIVTGTLMMILVALGFVLFAHAICPKRGAIVSAYLLMFVNGGLGFIYVFDRVFQDSSKLLAVFTGFYQTPTNMPELNLRWVNVICDMMIPQRTLLTGWMALLPALYLLTLAMRKRSTKLYVLLGVWAGTLPMIHSHSFLSLGLLSFGCMVYVLVHSENRMKSLLHFGIYGMLTLVFALPQLLKWTFPQTIDGGSMRLRFNWVNNNGDNTFIDGYVWFWVKNVGLVWLLMLPATLNLPKKSIERALAFGALCIYTVAECIQFQPNPYDNNKLFYVAYMVMLPIVARYLMRIWERLKSIRWRYVIAAAFAVISMLSGALSIARETISDYCLFGTDEVKTASYIEENLPTDCVILTGTQHNNAPAALCGRKIVCGTGSYLYYHGLDYSEQWNAVNSMFTDPENSHDLFEQYGVEYIYISSYERADFDVDEAWFENNCELIYENGTICLYKRQISED